MLAIDNILLIGGSRANEYQYIVKLLERIHDSYLAREHICHLFAPKSLGSMMIADCSLKDYIDRVQFLSAHDIDLHLFDIRELDEIIENKNINLIFLGANIGGDYDAQRAMLIAAISMKRPVILVHDGLAIVKTLTNIRRKDGIFYSYDAEEDVVLKLFDSHGERYSLKYFIELRNYK